VNHFVESKAIYVTISVNFCCGLITAAKGQKGSSSMHFDDLYRNTETVARPMLTMILKPVIPRIICQGFT